MFVTFAVETPLTGNQVTETQALAAKCKVKIARQGQFDYKVMGKPLKVAKFMRKFNTV